MDETDYRRVLQIVGELASVTPPRENEYWRGFRQGILRRVRGVTDEDGFQHRFWMSFNVRNGCDSGFEKYARGYREGFEGKDGPLETEIVLLRALASAHEAFASRAGRRASSRAAGTTNCGEFMKCGREMGGALEREGGVCPAYPDHGRSCARLLGTLCGGEVHGSMAKKLNDCFQCKFFQSEHYERIKDKD